MTKPRAELEALKGEENYPDASRSEKDRDESPPVVDSLLARVERCLAILRELKGD